MHQRSERLIMSSPMFSSAMNEVESAARRSREASFRLQGIELEKKNAALDAIIDALTDDRDRIVDANLQDLERAAKNGLAKPLLKRLRYDDHKLEESIESIRSLIDQPDPIGVILKRTELDEGLTLEKVSCPIGVIGIIFESRPDALLQISTLCIKSGNAVLLKGGSEAELTNRVLADSINDAIVGVDRRFEDAVQLLSTREEVSKLLELDSLVDLVIPRGSNELVKSIKEATRIPVLGHADGICHVYVHEDADPEMAARVCFDSKCQYPAVCNAMETMLVHQAIATRFLPKMAEEFSKAGVELRGDEDTRKIIGAKPATEEDWTAEYNDLMLAIRIVSSLDQAIEHINSYGSHHTDAIVTQDEKSATKFMDEVDSSSVLWNCSTRFADGYRYGLGAEVGISTNKTHARGPVGLEGLVIYKYRLYGGGQIVAAYSGENARKFTHRQLS